MSEPRTAAGRRLVGYLTPDAIDIVCDAEAEARAAGRQEGIRLGRIDGVRVGLDEARAAVVRVSPAASGFEVRSASIAAIDALRERSGDLPDNPMDEFPNVAGVPYDWRERSGE